MTNSEKDIEEEKQFLKRVPYLTFGTVLLIFFIFVVILLVATWPIDELSIVKSGVFGDSFGVITSLFSGLAFAGLIWTIFLQRHELILLRREHEQTRQEFRMSREQLIVQNFEFTFFQMLKLFNEKYDSIEITVKKVPKKGRICFKYLESEYRGILEEAMFHHPDNYNEDAIQHACYALWERQQHVLSHYFRYLHRILKFIDETDIPNKDLYSDTFRSQLTETELFLFFYFSVSTFGKDKYKPLAEKYAFFNHLPTEYLVEIEHAGHCSPEAWGEQKIYPI